MPLLPPPVSDRAAVLLIDADDETALPIKLWFNDTLPATHVTHCRSFADAQAHLGGAVVDLILARNVLPDATGLDVLRYVREQRIAAPVMVQEEALADGSEMALREAGALDVACTPRPEDRIARLRAVLGTANCGDGAAMGYPTLATTSGEIGHLRSLLRALCSEVGRVSHDVNNPITTLSGNAQFLNELGKSMDLDPFIAKAIEDIYHASHQLTAEIDKLTRLKEHLRQHVGHETVLPS